MPTGNPGVRWPEERKRAFAERLRQLHAERRARREAFIAKARENGKRGGRPRRPMALSNGNGADMAVAERFAQDDARIVRLFQAGVAMDMLAEGFALPRTTVENAIRARMNGASKRG